MAIRFICPHCGHIINVADSLDGRQGQCPNCSRFAMIQGQHIPDGNVANVVDITTAPENRPSTAGPDEKTLVLRNSGGAGAGAGNRTQGLAPPRTPVGTQSGIIRTPPRVGGASSPNIPAGPSLAPMGARTSGAVPAAPELEPEPAVEEELVLEEEDAGVGVKKLILSILAGAVAAAVIGLLIWKLVISDKPTDKPGQKDEDKKIVTTPYEGPIYKLKPSGRVAVLVCLREPANQDGSFDNVRAELGVFLDRAARPNTPVTEFTFCLAGRQGDPPLMFSGKCNQKDLGEGKGWINNNLLSPNADFLAAALAVIAKQPTELYIITGVELGKEFTDKVTAEAAAKKVQLFGIAYDTEDPAVIGDLRRLVKLQEKRIQKAGPGVREYGPADRSDKDK